MSDKSIDLVGKKIYLLHRIVQGRYLIFDIRQIVRLFKVSW